jgi:alpha-N-arabinofuranosidase
MKLLLTMATLFTITAAAQQPVKISIDKDKPPVTISRHIYGHFSEHLGRCIYDGLTRNGKIRMDVVNALKKIKIPNLRWPGGCFADQYHWHDGIGEKKNRPTTVNTTWGMVKEDNSFGTHEFLELCNLLNCEPYIAGNVGTGSPQEMSEWLEYLNFDGESSLAKLREANGHAQPYHVSFWGVGNESWGCGGNMKPEYYADLYRHFASFCHSYPGSPLKKIISGANGDDYNWTEVMMKKIGPDQAWGLSLHYYTLPTGQWNVKGSATHFTESEYAHTLSEALKMETIVSRNEEIMDKYDPQKRMALLVDEWGVWTDVEPGTNPAFLYQQNSLRDALIAASTLNIFNNHAERVRVANLAQVVNVIHSLILTRDDKMLLTPTYHIFDMYKVHQDAKLIRLHFKSPTYSGGGNSIDAVNVSASQDSNGTVHISMVNLDPSQTSVVQFALTGRKITGTILSSQKLTDINTFENPDVVSIKNFSAFSFKNESLEISLPPKSVVMLELTDVSYYY